MRHDAQHFVFGLADTHAADGVTRKIHSDELFQGGLAKVLEHTALHDAKQGVGIVQARKLILAATRPTQTHFHRLGGLRFGGQFAVGLVGRAFVELHGDVAVERGLNLHAHFGRHEQFVAVDRRCKVHAFFGDLAHRTQTPHLKTAAVSKNRFMPLLKAVQPAKALHHI